METNEQHNHVRILFLKILQMVISHLPLLPNHVLSKGLIDEKNVKLFFMNKARGGEMRQLMTREMSKEDLKDVFSVMCELSSPNS